jgi:hypothetical protein
MDTAQELFETLKSFKSKSETEFLDYCSQVLGSVEQFHVDFKEKQDRRHPNLDEDDRRNLAKAVSSFANSGGGVLIWGLKDKTLVPKPITDVKGFVRELLQLAPHVAEPIVANINADWIPTSSAPNDGFALVFVPESSLPPHRVMLNQDGIKNHYYVRSGDSFVIASHTMLEDMFGRRPKPNLVFNCKIVRRGGGGRQRTFAVILGIANKGRGTAKSPFLAVDVLEPYEISFYELDGNTNPGLPILTSSGSTKSRQYGSSQTIVIHPGIVIDVTLIDIKIDMENYLNTPKLVINYKLAAEGINLVEGQEVIDVSEIPAMFGIS